MPRSGYFAQFCPCGERAIVSISIGASTLRETPRRKAPMRTFYLCPGCSTTGPLRKKTLSTIAGNVRSQAALITKAQRRKRSRRRPAKKV